MTRVARVLILTSCLLVAGVAPAAVGSVVLASPAAGTWDVVVYGATPAGISAAIAAGRQGRRVVLVEPTAHIGGMMTSGLGMSDIGSKDAIGGLAREFFKRLGVAYQVPDGQPSWSMTPRVAERTFAGMLAKAHVEVVTRQRLREPGGVTVRDHRIQLISTEGGRTFAARVFVDASYEGDLMAQAGVSFVVGREAVGQYGESLAGVQSPQPELPVMMATTVSGRLAAGVAAGAPGALGSADRHIQPYTFRLCVSSDPADQVPFPKPVGYDPQRYLLVEGHLAALEQAGRNPVLANVLTISALPERKGDLNAAGPLSTDLVGGSDAYPTASYAQRAAIWQTHYRYEAGLLYFLANDSSVPASVQSELRRWGLCRDEFVDSGHWPPQLYVREARRMVSDFVLTQPDLMDQRQKPDSIGVGAYPIDAHATRLLAGPQSTLVVEGALATPIGGRYDIPYRILVPRRSEILNLLDPVTVSASHVAFASLRVEPQFMSMGEAAGVAASLAAKSATAVQDVDVTTIQSILASHGAVVRIGSSSTRTQATGQAGPNAVVRSASAATSAWFIGIMLLLLIGCGGLAVFVRLHGRSHREAM